MMALLIVVDGEIEPPFSDTGKAVYYSTVESVCSRSDLRHSV